MGGQESKIAEDETESCALEEPKSQQIPNLSNAYVVDDLMLLQRFIFLGTDGAFNTIDKEPKRSHAKCIDRLITAERGEQVVQLISDINHSGGAPRQNLIIFALAICARCNDLKTRKSAYMALGGICRIPTHLFMFVNYCKHESGEGKGWGRAHRNAITKWYLEQCKNSVKMGRLLTKYQRRKMKYDERKDEVWSHRDVLKLAHPKPNTDVMNIVFRFVIKGYEAEKTLAEEEMGNNDEIMKLISYLQATEKAKKSTDEEELVQIIREHRLEREHVPTQMLRSKIVWEALVTNMGIEAKIRNLGMISAKGICGEGSEVEKEIVSTLTNRRALRYARTHPFKVLLALLTYEKGSGSCWIERKQLKWKVNKNITSALDQAYSLSFTYVRSTGKRYLLAIDVSNSTRLVGNHAITCHQAAASMIMVTVRTEAKCKVVAFSDKLMRIDVNKNDSISTVLQKTEKKIEKTEKKIEIADAKKAENIPERNTDCALPMIWAKENKKKYDVFIVYTDNKPTCGEVKPSTALQDYRNSMNIPDAKLIVVAMASNEFSIADPKDVGMLDIVGFDSRATKLISEFSHHGFDQ